jgi:hypothetical protein
MPGSNKKIWWSCSEHGSYLMVVFDKVKGRNCPKCSNIKRTESYKQKILKSRGSLFSNKPELINFWDYERNNQIIDPRNVTVNSNTEVWWKCNNGHSWQSKICNMTHKRRLKICINCD